MIRAVPAVDRLEREGRVLLLYPGRLLEPAPLALHLVESARDWTGVDDLVGSAVAAFGQPPDGDAEQLVARVIDDLVTQGALERGGPADA